MGAMEGHGPQTPTPTWGCPGPASSWLQLVPPVSRSHLGRSPDKGGSHQQSHQEPPDKVCKAELAGAQQPCRESAKEAAPAMTLLASPAPLTQGPPPLVSTLSADPQDQSDLKTTPLDTIPKSSRNSFLSSTVPAVRSLGCISCPISFLSCCWETTKALFFPTSSKFQQEHHPAKAPFWGDPTNKQVEIGSPSFVNPDVQKLLEMLIAKRVKLKTWKEKEKGGSFAEQVSSDYHLNSLGSTWWSGGEEQNTTAPQSFWNMKDKPEQLSGPQQLSRPEVLRDHLEQKYSQLFWGLPSLHSESLVASALVPSSSQLKAPSVLFNGVSNGFPVSIQPSIPLSLSQAPLLPGLGTQSQLFTQNLPQSQPPPLAPRAEIQAQSYLPISLLFEPSSSPQMRTYGPSCPTFQKQAQSFIPPETQHRECHLQLQQQQQSGRPPPSAVRRSQEVFIPSLPLERGASPAQRSVSFLHGGLISPNLQNQHLQKRLNKDQLRSRLPCRIQLTLELNSPQGQFSGTYQTQGKQEPWRPPTFVGKSLKPHKTGSRCHRGSHRQSQTEFQPEKDFSKGLKPCLRRISKDRSRARFPVQFLEISSAKESERCLMRPLKSNIGRYLSRGPDKRHLEKVLRAHLGRKLGQINQGLIPVSMRQSWLVASHGSSESHIHKEMRNRAFLKHRKPCVNTFHELSFLSPSIQQMLEAHIIRYRVRHRWGLPPQDFEPINLKLYEAQPLSLPRSTFAPSATWQSGAHPKDSFATLLGKPQPHLGEKVTTGESRLTLMSPLPAPSPVCRETERPLGKIPPRDSQAPFEAPRQEGGPPSQTLTRSPMGRTWQRGTALAAKESNTEASSSSTVTRNKPRGESWGRASRDPCQSACILERDLQSQSSRARQALEAAQGEEDPAWEVTSGPSVLAKSQTSDVDRRRSGFPATCKSLSPPTKSAAQDPKKPHLKTQASEFELRSKVKSKNQPQGHATGDLRQDPHTDNLLQDHATGMLLQDSASKVLLQGPHTDVLLVADILASCRFPSSPLGAHASGEAPAFQALYGLKTSGQGSQGQQKSRKPKLRDPYKNQSEMPAPTNEWRAIRRLQPGKEEKSKSIQGQQEPRKPKVKDPCKGHIASSDEGEVCARLRTGEDEDWRAFKRLQPEEDEEAENQSEVLAPADERRGSSRRLQPGEHEEPKSIQGPQGPRKPEVKDLCRGQMASSDEGEVCARLRPGEDEDWRAFKRLQPEEDEEAEAQSEVPAPAEEEDWRSKLGEHEERFSGLRAPQASGRSLPPLARGAGESLGSKHLQPGKGHVSPEGHFSKRMRHYLQCLTPKKKGKEKEVFLQKSKPASNTAQRQEPNKGRFVTNSATVDARTIATAVGQILVDKLGLHALESPHRLTVGHWAPSGGSWGGGRWHRAPASHHHLQAQRGEDGARGLTPECPPSSSSPSPEGSHLQFLL
ncbi:spermatogenesis-associated protein 31E1-like [Camelus bactrianus]|uniref:Spermatogenesis-associated protein 31E1-like n=1 Tax=Camelus bactrianus TaxID=9837 RepID=A0AC58PNN6_CAMBA